MKISSTALFSVVMIVTSVAAVGIPIESFKLARSPSKVLKSLAIESGVAGNVAKQFYVPWRKRWNIQAIYVQVTCDSNPGDRYPYYEIVTSQGATIPRKSSTAFIASSTGCLTWVKNTVALTEVVIDSDVNGQIGWLPDVDLEGAGAYVIVSLVGGKAGDTYSCIVYGEEEGIA